jgi:hypothetical protein
MRPSSSQRSARQVETHQRRIRRRTADSWTWQFNYALHLFKPVLYKELDSVDVTERATERFNAWLHRRLENSVFTQCASWYRVGQAGKVSSIWPGPIALFWWETLWVRWGDYEVRGARRSLWALRRRLAAVARLLVAVSVAGAAGALWHSKAPSEKIFDALRSYLVRTAYSWTRADIDYS